MIKVSASSAEAAVQVRLRHTTDITTNTQAVRRCGVRSGWPSVSAQRKGQITSLICSFCLNVVACQIVQANPSMIDTLSVAETNNR